MKISTIIIIVLRNLELGLRDLFRLRYRPYKVLLELTDHCNSKCKTCDIWKNDGTKKNEISLTDIEAVLREYGANLLWIALGGGEVTLYRDFEALIDLFKVHCPNLRILTFTTNALLPEKVLSHARKIKEEGYDVFITVSLDGDQETHDFVRGVAGNYVKTKQTLEQLKELKIWSHFGLTVSAFNSLYIENRLKDDIGEVRSFSFEHAGGIYKTSTEPNDKAILKSLRIIKKLYKVRQAGEFIEYLYMILAGAFFSSGRKKVPVACDVIGSSLHVRPNGDISPCMYLPRIGSIKTTTFGSALRTVEAKALRKRAQNTDCGKCWMNCYAVHSIMRHPLITAFATVRALVKF